MVDEWEDVKPTKSPPKDRSLMVTIDHIRRAVHGQSTKDPIAIALAEYAEARYAIVGWGYGKTYHNNNVEKGWTLWPFKVIRDFCKAWDEGRSVSPITINAMLDKEIDKTPKPSKRKVPHHKNFADLQIKLGLE